MRTPQDDEPVDKSTETPAPTNIDTPTDIRARQGALALLELKFDNKDEPISAKENILRAIQQDQPEIVTGSMDDYTAKPILITIFWERANGNITPADALELVENFCKRLKETGGELGILDLASLYTETVDGEKLLTPADMEIVLKLAPVNESDIAILAPMFPDGMDIWEKACPNLQNLLPADELNTLQGDNETENTMQFRRPGLLKRRRAIFAAAALAVIAAAGALTRTSWESSSSGETQPATKISSLPQKEAIPQSPPVQTISKETQATKEHIAKTLQSKPVAANTTAAPKPESTRPIKIASSRPAPVPTPPASVRPPSPTITPAQPAQAPVQPSSTTAPAPKAAETAPTLSIPVSTKPGPIGPQFDETDSINQWKSAGWTVKVGLRPGGTKSYTLTKGVYSARIINPKVTAGQTTIEAEQVQVQ